MPLQIIRDTREQDGFSFVGFPCTVTAGTLEAGDYSLAGFERRVAIERKSLPDLVACLGVERERFARELARLRGYDCAAVVVEATADDLRAGHFRARLNPEAAWQSVLAFTQRYRIPFFWAENRADAEETTFHLLRHYQHDRMRELQALRIPARIAPERQTAQGPGAGVEGKPDTPESRTEGKANSTAPTATATGAGL